MSQATYETTMKDLLTGLKKLSIRYSNGDITNTLYAVKTFKRGLISQQTIFPAMVFVPKAERIIKIYSGGKYKIEREIDIVIYTKAFHTSDALKQAMELAESFKSIFRDNNNVTNFNIKDEYDRETTYSYTFLPFAFGEIEDFDKATVLQSVIIPSTWRSDEYFPAREVESTLVATTSKGIGEKVYEKITEAENLKTVKLAYNYTTPPVPVMRGVALTVMPRDENQVLGAFTGHSGVTRNIDIYIWSKASPYEDMLDINLDTVEKVKDILQKNVQMDGLCYNSSIPEILFGVNEELLLYGSRITFQTQSMEILPVN